jgi:magnesium-transporting ATPase (P-type)
VSIYVTGAPEMLIDLCSTVLSNENTAELGQDERQKISHHISNMAMQPLRVIGMAYLELTMAQW